MKRFVKKCFLLFVVIAGNSFCQETATESLENVNRINIQFPVNLNSSRELLSKTPADNNETLAPERILAGYNFMYLRNKFKKEEKYTFDVVSSFGDNIRFGGFWERYAIVNFSPQMYIQPTDFLSLYANHNLSSFVPFEEVKDHIKAFAIQSLSVMAIDNSIKFLFPSDHWIPKAIGFVFKNLIINLFIKPGIKNSNRQSIPWIQDESYYYSLRLIF